MKLSNLQNAVRSAVAIRCRTLASSSRIVFAVSFTCLVVTLASAVAQEVRQSNTLTQENGNLDVIENAAKGEFVSELGPSVMYVFQANNGDYWFGSNDRVRSILEDRKGNYWFTYTGEKPLSQLRTVRDFGKMKEKETVLGTIVDGLSVIEDEQGKLWTAALSKGAFSYEGTTKTSHPINQGNTKIEVFAVYKDNAGVLWLGTHNGGAYRFTGQSFERFRLPRPLE